MTKKEKFINYIDEQVFAKIDVNSIDQDIILYWEALKGKPEAEKPLFTDNGKLILKYLQEEAEDTSQMFKAKDIAEGLFISSRAVSGAIRKLVTDGFVDKVGADPVVYSITEKGKNIKIED
jgi:DNA-binding MarR family transcriptional regulator